MISEKYLEPMVVKFAKDRNLRPSTSNLYACGLDDYSKFHNMTLKELIDEADYEEEMGVREKRRKVKTRLQDYLNHKINSDSSVGTVKKYFEIVKTFYRHHEIVIPYIPTIQLKKDFHEKYEDIPKITHIRKAINSTDDLCEKAIILFMSSSGTARNETLSLTVGDFIEATKSYHKRKTIDAVLQQLESKENIVPLFELVRIKTDYHYYTCCSPQATEMIIKYLKTRKTISKEDKLFETNRQKLSRTFLRINAKHKWGKVGYYAFFRSHMMRKFHATMIGDKSLVDALQGRKRDPITESYYKLDPDMLRRRYKKVMSKVMI